MLARGMEEGQKEAGDREWLFQGIDIYQTVHDGVDSQTRRRMDIQFRGDMFAVRDDGVHGDTEHVGDLFVTQAPNDLDKHIFLTVRQFLRLRQLVPTMSARFLLRQDRT